MNFPFSQSILIYMISKLFLVLPDLNGTAYNEHRNEQNDGNQIPAVIDHYVYYARTAVREYLNSLVYSRDR